MAENAIPSKDPADEGTMSGMLQSILRKVLMDVHCQLPAVVEAYDRDRNRATVRPLIAVLTTDGEAVSRASIADVPVLAIGGGGFVINFPLEKGDFGWIEASDRDISLFLQNGGEARPNTLRLHDFSDCRFIPDVFAKYTFADSEGPEGMTIQSLDGSQRIVVHDNGMHVKCSALVADVETATVTATGPVSVSSVESITLTAPVITLAGQVYAASGISAIPGTPPAPGTIMANEAIINGVTQSTHIHKFGGDPSTGPENA